MAKLVLVPTPISDEQAWSPIVCENLKSAFEAGDVIVVEEHKIARRKWVANKLPREAIDEFICFNEHTREEIQPEIIQKLKAGKNVYLLSDCGLPAFCDPGQELVSECHDRGIQVSSLPFDNSGILAVALSGFPAESFYFGGFINRDDRLGSLKKLTSRNETTVIMDTPYRLSKIITELEKLGVKRQVFVGIDLNSSSELLIRGPIEQVVKDLNNVNKREFVLVLGPNVRR